MSLSRRYFGGAPQYVVLDNLKEGVLSPDLYEPQINPTYQSMLAHYGVVATTETSESMPARSMRSWVAPLYYAEDLGGRLIDA